MSKNKIIGVALVLLSPILGFLLSEIAVGYIGGLIDGEFAVFVLPILSYISVLVAGILIFISEGVNSKNNN